MMFIEIGGDIINVNNIISIRKSHDDGGYTLCLQDNIVIHLSSDKYSQIVDKLKPYIKTIYLP